MLFGNDFLGPFMSAGNEGNTGSAGDEKGGCQFYEEIYSFFGDLPSEGYVPDEPVNHRGDHVHHQDGIADAFGVAATQTDQGGQDTQPMA